MCFCEEHVRRKGVKYERNQAVPCPKCSFAVAETKDLSMSGKESVLSLFGADSCKGAGTMFFQYESTNMDGREQQPTADMTTMTSHPRLEAASHTATAMVMLGKMKTTKMKKAMKRRKAKTKMRMMTTRSVAMMRKKNAVMTLLMMVIS